MYGLIQFLPNEPIFEKKIANSCICMSGYPSTYAHRQENKSLEAYTAKAAASRGQASKDHSDLGEPECAQSF